MRGLQLLLQSSTSIKSVVNVDRRDGGGLSNFFPEDASICYINRMKEYEREKRLLQRKQRIEKKQAQELHA